MKISELNTQSFLGGTNVPANSYVLINYAEDGSATPVTKKVSVQELGKAIANDQQLYKKTQDGAVTTSVSSGAYVNGTAQQLMTAAEKANLDAINITMRNGDNAPELTLTKSLNVSKVITNNDSPVVYNSSNNTLQYINGANGAVTIDVGGGSGFNPEEGYEDTDNEITVSYMAYSNDNKKFYHITGCGAQQIPFGVYDSTGGFYEPIVISSGVFYTVNESGNLSSSVSLNHSNSVSASEVTALDCYVLTIGNSEIDVPKFDTAVRYSNGYFMYGSTITTEGCIELSQVAYIGESNGVPAIYDYQGIFVGLLTQP